MNAKLRHQGLVTAVIAACVLSGSMLVGEALVRLEHVDSGTQKLRLQADCQMLDPQDHFPDLIVERVLVKKGISRGDISKINQALDTIKPSVNERYRHRLKQQSGDETIWDREGQEIALEIMHNVRLEVFSEVMITYMDDAEIAQEAFDLIMQRSERAMTRCLK